MFDAITVHAPYESRLCTAKSTPFANSEKCTGTKPRGPLESTKVPQKGRKANPNKPKQSQFRWLLPIAKSFRMSKPIFGVEEQTQTGPSAGAIAGWPCTRPSEESAHSGHDTVEPFREWLSSARRGGRSAHSVTLGSAPGSRACP